MATNSAKDEEYINKLVEIKRYLRSDSKFQELIEKADLILSEADYSNSWKEKRDKLIKYISDYFQLDDKVTSTVKMIDITPVDNTNESFSFVIQIERSPIKPKYAIGVEDDEIEKEYKIHDSAFVTF